MRYRLFKDVLHKKAIYFYNRENEGLGLRVTGDVLEVNYNEREECGLRIRYIVFTGGQFTKADSVRDLGDCYEVVTRWGCYKVAKKDVEIIERAPR